MTFVSINKKTGVNDPFEGNITNEESRLVNQIKLLLVVMNKEQLRKIIL